MSSADETYDRLHGLDGHVQAVPRLTAVERNLLADRLVSWFGDERQAFLVSQIAPVVDRIIAARVGEFQHNAVEMARKADIAEAERDTALSAAERHYAAFVGAETKLARLRAAADLVGHQAACLVDPCDCWMSDLAPLLEYERPEWVKVAEGEQGAEGDAWRVTLYEERPGPHVPDCACLPPYASCSHPPCACDGCIGDACDHQWLDRPESDTRECLVCGTERV